MTATPRQVVPDLLLLGLAAALSVQLAIGGRDLALVGAALAVAPTLAMLAVLRRAGHWPRRSMSEPVLQTLQDLVPFGGALVVGGLTTALLRASGLGLLEPSGLANAVLTSVRFVAWTFTIGTLVAIWVDRPHQRTAPISTRRRVRLLEWMLTTLGAVWAVWLSFVSEDRLPAIYPLFLVVVWASLRTSLRVAVSLSALIGLAGVVLTLARIGPFAAVTEPRTGAVLAQGFVVCMVLVALVLSLSLRDRHSALAQAEREGDIARDRAALLDAVLTNIEEGILVVQDDDQIMLGNAASQHLLPHLLDASAFKLPDAHSPHTLTSADGNPLNYDSLPTRLVLTNRYDGARDVGVRRNGKLTRTLEVKATNLPTHSSDDHARAVVTLRDVTTEREERSELEAFAGVVAHDLANPLTIIVGWSEALLELSDDSASLDATQLRELAGRLLGASSHMQMFINDLLAYTLSRHDVLQSTTVDLSEMCRSISSLRDVASHVDIGAGIQVHGDAALLRQLLDNLLANAMKYTVPGSTPQVSVTAAGDHQQVTVSIQDNGIGISAEEQDRVFDDFFRASTVRSTYRGTGLGLAICKRVVSRHGGEIWVDHSVTAPEPNHGTRVCFTIPTGPRQEHVLPAAGLPVV
ncbi:phospho-acceptor domain-containing protein [Nocardioides aurantiacus]|uniref:Sensor-like histidine kinase SenX3 n=2 Tax=Nocardioides aurantiacus TaxID=86796 RepID=A0A3N2CTX8_9ACTN|nr:phospho-acceptor domain-containing protein [Nocardioides aurantiacus]